MNIDIIENKSLSEALPCEIERVVRMVTLKVIPHDSVKHELDAAEAALMSNDTKGMLNAYKSLKNVV